MRIAFTGTRKLQPGDAAKIAAVIEALPQDAELITGACVGVDAHIARVGHALYRQVHTVVPSNGSQVDPAWMHYCTSATVLGPGAPEPYRERNEYMVERCDRLIAFPDREESHGSQRRSGTWMTVRIARAAQKPVEIHILHAEKGTDHD